MKPHNNIIHVPHVHLKCKLTDSEVVVIESATYNLQNYVLYLFVSNEKNTIFIDRPIGLLVNHFIQSYEIFLLGGSIGHFGMR